MKTTANNNATQNQKTQGASSFEEILKQQMELLEKNVRQAMTVTHAVGEIINHLEEKFDLILDADLDIMECPCENNCGSIKVTVPFTAMTFTGEGLGIHEGEISVIIKKKG